MANKPKDQQYYDAKIKAFKEATDLYIYLLTDHLNTFSPLSNEDEEKDLKKINQLLKKYINNHS